MSITAFESCVLERGRILMEGMFCCCCGVDRRHMPEIAKLMREK